MTKPLLSFIADEDLYRCVTEVLTVAQKAQKDIVPDLNRVDIQQALCRRHQGKVDGMRRHPNGPAAHDGR